MLGLIYKIQQHQGRYLTFIQVHKRRSSVYGTLLFTEDLYRTKNVAVRLPFFSYQV